MFRNCHDNECNLRGIHQECNKNNNFLNLINQKLLFSLYKSSLVHIESKFLNKT